MIISRTPFRISFFGGGTDYPQWYREHGGAVLSTTINKYCYISCRYLPPFFKHKYLIRYRMQELVNDVSEIEHPSVRECLKFMGVDEGIEMVHASDLPARSGIGSSSAFTVGFLNALAALGGKMFTKRHLASKAIHVEQNLIQENVGSQDQAATSFGGFNRIDFGGEDEFYVRPMTIGHERRVQLDDCLMLFFTGISRTASEIAQEQVKSIGSHGKEMKMMKQLVDEATEVLNNGSDDFHEFGKLLDETWQIKRSLTDKISPRWVDGIYDDAKKAGALGGKLCGAGGGGFMLLFVPPERQQNVREKLEKTLHVPFHFESLGSQIILYESGNGS